MKKEQITFIGLVGLFLLLYWLTGSRLVTNYADADDLTLAARFLGLAHPPGYSMLIWLLHPVLRLLPNSLVATGASAFSAINVICLSAREQATKAEVFRPRLSFK